MLLDTLEHTFKHPWSYIASASWRIVRYPLDSFMVGQAVRVLTDGSREG